MATLTYQQSKITGSTVATVAASVGGDKVAPNSRGALMVINNSAGAITGTVVTPGNTQYGQSDPDVPFSVAAGTTALVGPFPQSLSGDDGLIAITYSAVTSVTVAAITT